MRRIRLAGSIALSARFEPPFCTFSSAPTSKSVAMDALSRTAMCARFQTEKTDLRFAGTRITRCGLSTRRRAARERRVGPGSRSDLSVLMSTRKRSSSPSLKPAARSARSARCRIDRRPYPPGPEAGSPNQLRVCYEAGPTGDVLYWQLIGLGVHCDVVAPRWCRRRPVIG